MKIGPILLNQCVPNLFRISGYFENSEFDFSRFYCKMFLCVFNCRRAKIFYLDRQANTLPRRC